MSTSPNNEKNTVFLGDGWSIFMTKYFL